jgi:hypothetical protein
VQQSPSEVKGDKTSSVFVQPQAAQTVEKPYHGKDNVENLD